MWRAKIPAFKYEEKYVTFPYPASTLETVTSLLETTAVTAPGLQCFRSSRHPVLGLHPSRALATALPLRSRLACGHCVPQGRAAFLGCRAVSEALHKGRGIHRCPIARLSSSCVLDLSPALDLSPDALGVQQNILEMKSV